MNGSRSDAFNEELIDALEVISSGIEVKSRGNKLEVKPDCGSHEAIILEDDAVKVVNRRGRLTEVMRTSGWSPTSLAILIAGRPMHHEED